jgi:polar amino acid transport system substrate-binding protein
MRIDLRLVTILASLLLSTAACDSLPKDQKGTMERIRSTGEIRVGLSEQDPFVTTRDGEPAGVEVEILKRFAESLNARPVWSYGGEERLIKSLEHFDLDIVAGGLTKKTPWKKYVGTTGVYRDEQVFAVPPGENELVRRLDDYTFTHKSEIEQLFADEGAKR